MCISIDSFYRWYINRCGDVINGADEEKAKESEDILKKVNDAKVFEHLKQITDYFDSRDKDSEFEEERRKEEMEAKKDRREFWIRVAKFSASFLFNIVLCGSVFHYETVAPIITKCFAWVKPMAL